MADRIQILIEAILQKTTKENLETELKRIESQLKPIKVDVDIKDANKEIQKFAQTFYQVEGTSEKLIKEMEQYKNSLGQVVKEVRNIKEVYDEQGRAQNVVSSTIKTITTDYEKQRKELEKLNAEQSKYWSQRVKETVEGMTRKPDALTKMADYYKQLEKEQQLLEKLNAEQSKYWSQRVKETVEDMTRKSDALTKMADYYKQLEKEQQLLEKLNAEQSKYWSQRVKETVEGMTRRPDALTKMADYYKQLEKEQQLLEKLNAEQSKYWSLRVKERVEDMTRKPDELIKMADYYKQLEKEQQLLKKLNAEQSKYWSQRVKETVEGMTRKPDALIKMADYYKQLEKEQQLNETIQKRIELYKQEAEAKLLNLKSRYGDLLNNTDIKKQIDAFRESLNNLNTNNFNAQKLNADFKMIEASVKNAQNAVKATNRDVMSFGDMFKVAWNKMVIWAGAGTLLFGTIRQIKKGISYISELDNSLNEIRIVTNKTQQEVNNLALSYNKLAKEMNVTTKEVASTAADLFRQGLDEGQVEERMRAVIQYAKISSISLEESNKIITATANATGESVRKIIDIFAYLGDATASGAEEIGEALQKVASTAENSGVSLEKAASWIATISSITRESASSIGNSLKTIISRYEQIKAKGFNEEDATQINDVTKALQAVGIVAVDAQGQLRPIAEVLDELSAKWNSLTKNEQAYVATTLAGTYQRNRLITLLDNYNDSLKNYEAALNSAGIAEEKFAIYQDSVQAKLDKLSATWEEFWQKSLNSDLIKGTIEALTKLIDTFGNLRTVLSLIATGFALWKGTQITKWFTTSKVAAEGLRVSIIKTRGAIIGLTEAEIAARTATTGLTLSWNALKTAFWSNPIGFVVAAFTTLIVVMDIVKQKQEEMRQKIEESAQKAKEQSDSIAELMGKYNELIDLVDKDKNAKTQLQSVQDELIKTLGLEKEAIDLVNDSREESIKKIREEAIERLKANENALIAAKNLAEEEKKNKKGSSSFLGISGYEYVGSPILSDKEKKAFNLMKTISGLRVERSALGTFILMADYMATAEERAEILETALQALKDAGLENTNVFNQLALSQQGYNDVINKAKEATDAVNKSIAERLILEKENEIGVPKTVQAFKDFRKAILDNSSGTEDFKRVLDELLSQQYPQFAKQTKDNSNLILDLSNSYENLLKSISNTSDDLKTLNQILNDVQNGQSLNAETVLDLIQKHEELIPAIHKTADGWTIEKDAIENLRKVKIEEARVAIENQIKSAEATLDNVSARVRAYGIEIAAIEDLKSAQQEVSKLEFKNFFGENAFENIKFDDLTNRISIGNKVTDWSKDEYKKIKQSFNEQKLINDTILKIGELKERNKKLLELLSDPNFGVSSSKSSSSKSTTEIYKAEINQFQQLEDALAKVNYEIERNQALTDLAKEEDKINLLSKRIDLYKLEQEILHQLAEARRNVIQQNVGKLQGLGFDISYDKNANELLIRNIERLNQLKGKDAEATNKLRKETEKLINDTISLNKTNQDAAIEWFEINKNIKSITDDIIKLKYELFELSISPITEEIKEYENQINTLKEGLMFASDEQKVQDLNNINSLIDKQKQSLSELLKKYEEQLALLPETSDQYKELKQSIEDTRLEIIKLDNAQKENIETIKNLAKELIDSYQNYIISSIEDEIDKWEEAKKAARKSAEAKIDAIQAEIDKLEERNKQLEIEEERQKRLADLAKQRELVENIKKEKNVRLYQNGEWIWVADPKKLKEETEKLKEMQEDYHKWEIENSHKAEIEKLRNQIKKIREDLKRDEEYYDKKIESAQNFLKEYKKQWDLQKEQVTSYQDLIQKLSGIEQEVWNTRLTQLTKFIEDWNNLASQLNAPTIQIPNVSSKQPINTNVSSKQSINTKDSSTKNNATATLPNGQTIPVSIENGKTVTKGLPVGTVVHTAGGDYKIVEVKPDGSYIGQKVPGFSDGGWVDYTGLAVVHGTPSKPEAFLKHDDAKLIYNAANLLKNIANNIKMPSINLPEIKIPFISNNNSVAKPIENHYHFENLNIQANDPNEMFRKLNMLIEQYT